MCLPWALPSKIRDSAEQFNQLPAHVRIVLTSHDGPLTREPRVVLPVCSWAETEGTILNAMGLAQVSEQAISCKGCHFRVGSGCLIWLERSDTSLTVASTDDARALVERQPGLIPRVCRTDGIATMTSLTEILIIVAKVVFLALLFCMPVAVLLTWADRRQGAMIQDRVGPNRAAIFMSGKLAAALTVIPALGLAALALGWAWLNKTEGNTPDR